MKLQSPVVGTASAESSPQIASSTHGVEVKVRPENRTLRRRLLPAGICIAGSVHCYFSYASLGEPLSWPRSFALGISLWYAWAILSLIIYQWTRFLPWEAGLWSQRLGVHIGAGIVFALAKLVMDFPIIKFIYCPEPELLTFPVFIRMALVGYFFRYLLISWLLTGVA